MKLTLEIRIKENADKIILALIDDGFTVSCEPSYSDTERADWYDIIITKEDYPDSFSIEKIN